MPDRVARRAAAAQRLAAGFDAPPAVRNRTHNKQTMSFPAGGPLAGMEKFSGAVDGPDYAEWLREVEALAAGEILPDLLPLLWRNSTGRARLALAGCGAPLTMPLAQRQVLALARNSAKDTDIQPALKLLDERQQKAVDALQAQFTVAGGNTAGF